MGNSDIQQIKTCYFFNKLEKERCVNQKWYVVYVGDVLKCIKRKGNLTIFSFDF